MDSLDSSRFVPTEREELRVLAEHINTQKFYFIRNDELDPDSAARASRLAEDISRLASLDELLAEFNLRFEIRAFADTSGTPEQHSAVRRLRAEALMQYLSVNGIREDAISIIAGQPEPATDESLRWRRAEIKTLIEDAKQGAERT